MTTHCRFQHSWCKLLTLRLFFFERKIQLISMPHSFYPHYLNYGSLERAKDVSHPVKAAAIRTHVIFSTVETRINEFCSVETNVREIINISENECRTPHQWQVQYVRGYTVYVCTMACLVKREIASISTKVTAVSHVNGCIMFDGTTAAIKCVFVFFNYILFLCYDVAAETVVLVKNYIPKYSTPWPN